MAKIKSENTKFNKESRTSKNGPTDKGGRKIFAFLLVIAGMGILIFIFWNSFQTRTESSRISSGVLTWIKPFLEIFVGEGNVTTHLVRKLAHFAEFTALGMDFMGISAVALKKRIYGPLLFGLMAACADETIQIYSNRGSALTDVWLDFSGIVFGVLLVFVLCAILSKKKKRTP